MGGDTIILTKNTSVLSLVIPKHQILTLKGITMCVSFSNMGQSKAEREIEDHENGQTEVQTKLKPFTIKTQAHQIEALDVVSELMGISRSALVVKLINHYLGQAIYEYLSGYNSVFSHEKPEQVIVLEDLEKILNKSEGLSKEARQFLITAISSVAFDM